MGPKPVKNEIFRQWSPTLWEGQTDPLGPILTRFQPVWPILAQFLLYLETVMVANMGPNPVKNEFCQNWPQTLWGASVGGGGGGDQTDLSVPIWGLF